jgi:hypothetical protein
MAYIPSAYSDPRSVTPLGVDTGYSHPADTRRGGVPLAFQITSPFDSTKVLLPHALVMHVNPESISETYTKKSEVVPTRGGFVENHWGDDLTDISADGSTGAFMNVYTGLTSVLRQKTIAWSKYRDLHDLYMNNGALFNPDGQIVLQGKVMLIYDRGIYLGGFRDFSVEETAESPFAFKLNWSFRVEHTITSLAIPQSAGLTAPSFQKLNR